MSAQWYNETVWLNYEIIVSEKRNFLNTFIIIFKVNNIV